METDKQGALARRIVTLGSIESHAKDAEASRSALESAESRDLKERLLKARHDQLLKNLEAETERVGSRNVMITVPDRDVALLQSELARRADLTAALPSNALEAKFGTGISGGDWFGWLKSLFDWVDRQDAHAIVRPSSSTPEKIDDNARLAIMGDWGTGLYGAPHIAANIQKQAPFDLLLHLGDVYYAGTKAEVQERFLDVWPTGAGKISRALNSNHEMYSGGFGYFDLTLPTFQQGSSYFALQNSHWLMICLDTAYVDHDIDGQQVGWLNEVIQQGGKRKIVLFSHQQLFSRLDNQGPKLQKALKPLLESKLITAWYWGHEHNCVVYDRHPEYGLLGRCLGNGGIPSPRKQSVVSAPTAKMYGSVSWKSLAKTDESPACIVLDGPNQFVEGEQDKFDPHGYMTLEFNGSTLTERVFLANGTELHLNQIS